MPKNLTWLICVTCISVENRRLFIITRVDMSPLVWGGNMARSVHFINVCFF